MRFGSSQTERHPTPAADPGVGQDFRWLLIGQAVYAAAQWGILVALAHFGSAADVGRFALGLAIATPISLFLGLGLSSAAATDAVHRLQRADYLTLRTLTATVGALVVLAVAVLGSFGTTTAAVIGIVGLLKAFDSVSEIYFGLLQRDLRIRLIAETLIINATVSLAALIAVEALTHDLIWAVAATTAGSAVALSSVALRVRTRAWRSPEQRQPPVPPGRLLGLARLSLPLGFAAFGISINANIPRYFVAGQLDQASLGVYAVMAFVIGAGMLLMSALGQAASPRLASLYANGDRAAFRSLLIRLILFGAGAGVAFAITVLAFGRLMLTELFGSSYATEVDAFRWLALFSGIGFVASALGFAMTATRRFKAQPPILALSIISTLVASALLIPSAGLSGAAVSTGIGMAVQLLSGVVVVRRALTSREAPIGDRGRIRADVIS